MSLDKLKEQVEFYFSDSNYAKDKFMIAKAAENDGFIPITVLLTFKRLQAMGATVESIKEAVGSSDVVEMKDDSLRKIQTAEFKEYLNDKDVGKRVVYMRGFKPEATLDEIKELLEKHCKPVRVIMRRNETREFKGSCFVEFATAEEAVKAVSLEIFQEGAAEPLGDGESQAKKQRVEPGRIEVMSKEEYLGKRKTKGEEKEEKFGKRVKMSFARKLYRFEYEGEPEIKKIKEAVKECAFVDVPKRVIRMKYEEEWAEKEVEVGSESMKLRRMSEEETEEYLKGITIKKVSKNKAS